MIPAQWQISLDDQTNYTTNIHDGDSSDFMLIAGQPFPQKLNIGAVRNDTPRIGSVYLDIFDPEFLPFVIRLNFSSLLDPLA